MAGYYNNSASNLSAKGKHGNASINLETNSKPVTTKNLTKPADTHLEQKFAKYSDQKHGQKLGVLEGPNKEVPDKQEETHSKIKTRVHGPQETSLAQTLPEGKELNSKDQSNFSMNLTYGSPFGSAENFQCMAVQVHEMKDDVKKSQVGETILQRESGQSRGKSAASDHKESDKQSNRKKLESIAAKIQKKASSIDKTDHRTAKNHSDVFTSLKSSSASYRHGQTKEELLSKGNSISIESAKGNQLSSPERDILGVVTFGSTNPIVAESLRTRESPYQKKNDEKQIYSVPSSHKNKGQSTSGFRYQAERSNQFRSYEPDETSKKVTVQEIYQKLSKFNDLNELDFKKKSTPVKTLESISGFKKAGETSKRPHEKEYLKLGTFQDQSSEKNMNYAKSYYRGSSISGERPTMNTSNGDTGNQSSSRQRKTGSLSNFNAEGRHNNPKSVFGSGPITSTNQYYREKKQQHRKDVNHNLKNFNTGEVKSMNQDHHRIPLDKNMKKGNSQADLRTSEADQSPSTVRDRIKSLIKDDQPKVKAPSLSEQYLSPLFQAIRFVNDGPAAK